MPTKSDLIVGFSDIDREDIELVGEEAVKLSEIQRLNVSIPKGFVVTTKAYLEFLQPLFSSKRGYVINDRSFMPSNVVGEVFKSYKRLEGPLKDAWVNVVPSIYSKNLLNLTFKLKKYTYVKGEANLIQKIRSAWASFFTSLLTLQHIDYSKIKPAIVVCKVSPNSDSAVMYTIDPKTNDKTKIVINQGDKTGNHYEVLKGTLKIIDKPSLTWRMLTDRQIISLASWGKSLQEYYYFPQEVHFSIDKSDVYVTLTKPMQDIAARDKIQNAKLHKGNNNRTVLLKGNPIHPGIARGYLRIIRNTHDVNKIASGDVAIVTNTKCLKLDQTLRKARAIVIEGKFPNMPHISISKRFYGKPMIVATPNSSKVLRDGVVVTLNATTGEVYQ